MSKDVYFTIRRYDCFSALSKYRAFPNSGRVDYLHYLTREDAIIQVHGFIYLLYWGLNLKPYAGKTNSLPLSYRPSPRLFINKAID
jgi:hypothetical protein